ncbi:23S rRNA pseudouridine955/2504/2580 synthase [Hypnocyclicus thermotrophus]|uniref:23S rRNA pseudouridine955/2504/2580 synthase n=1 Tax=Hypnocyclicus thermotrophus TaxID=1627895 RepID=A0AA46DYB7_9FUSO|nr:RluA family pseudouridine synthase [Hypnocyclicus thermotrophus]TDT69200.1 23S rRNA pseudouridine955/2504/2580 synthase [Hypnocyclicus thermotrophus]
MIKIIINEQYENSRIDKYIRKNYPKLKLGDIFKFLRSGKIKVNNKKVKQNYRLNIGDELSLYFIYENEEYKYYKLNEKEKQDIKNRIIYEDEEILIFFKNPKEVMHKGSGYEVGISEKLKSYLKNKNFSFVNRIDKDTSGLILGGKTLPKIRELTEIIRERNISKKYYLLVKGNINKNRFEIKNKLLNNGDKVVVDDNGKIAITKYRVIERYNSFTLLEAEILTGRKHQIRVQMQNIGHSIIGDKKYGGINDKYMYLNSYSISFDKIDIQTDIPNYFKKYINNKNIKHL